LLEPARKRARPVLRGAGRSNAPGLPGELVGDFKNGGREYQPAGQPERVDVHDFPDPDLGKAIPYGIYDVSANTGWVSVGIDHDTSAFAVATLRSWWTTIGKDRYPNAHRLLICADSGGSNGSRIRAWKIELAQFATDTGLSVTVTHLPPGTSKWNKIEHRLFSQITLNWRGRPLRTHQVIVDLISNTTTATGLRVDCVLDTDQYPIGLRYTKKDIGGAIIAVLFVVGCRCAERTGGRPCRLAVDRLADR